MRLALIVCVVSMTAVAGAQTVTKGAGASPTAHQTPAPPRPAPAPPPPPAAPRTTPPPIVFPLPPIAPPPAGGRTPPVRFTPPLPAGTPPVDMFRTGRRNPYRTHCYAPGVAGIGGYGVGGYDIGAADTNAVPGDAGAAATGLLRLSVTPGDAQVFIDSYYVGTVADIEAGRVLTLPAGPHRLEIRASDYQTTVVDIRIAPYETVTYRAALDRVPPAAPPSRAAAAAGSPMYLIPNCYLDNVPPRPSRLPSGCNIKRVQMLGAR